MNEMWLHGIQTPKTNHLEILTADCSHKSSPRLGGGAYGSFEDDEAEARSVESSPLICVHLRNLRSRIILRHDRRR